MKIQTDKLEGACLNYAVAMAQGKNVVVVGGNRPEHTVRTRPNPNSPAYDYSPSTDWSVAGPIIDNHIHTLIKRDGRWQAEAFDDTKFCLSIYGPTALIAAMRTYVASRLGYEVEIPELCVIADRYPDVVHTNNDAPKSQP